MNTFKIKFESVKKIKKIQLCLKAVNLLFETFLQNLSIKCLSIKFYILFLTFKYIGNFAAQ